MNMNWKLMSQLVTTVFIKLIGTSLFLFYFSQIFQKVPKATPRGEEGCSIRWVPFRGKCYYFSAVEKTWDESQEDCALYNSHLAVVNNYEELVEPT
ncbi:C-type lectin domain family 5 member A-like [Sceloporus undulatus]|uniref:C-type lectin domain family 5 member A-like n=1 Tax=Sceloporus undulatus TaxID=8520 RepID=UPI001C4BE989|nr:C-type lectin domain family 5 member A-like [Sceloporus undulatus]